MERRNLARILGATTVATFFSDIIERQVLHSRACFTAGDIDELLSLGAIDELFSRFPLHPSRYQVIKEGTVDRTPTLHSAGGMDPNEMVHAYREGQTIRLNAVHESVARVRRLCRELAAECSCPIYANVYMTPAGNPGFNPHYDDHDVIIVQCHGSKEWRIHKTYKNQVELPLAGFEFDAEKYAPGAASESMVLEPGDTLYIPRGWMHSARAQESDSVHITLSMNWPTWNELLVDVVARAALDNVSLRRSIISTTHAEPAAIRAAVLEHIAKLFRIAMDEAFIHESIRDLMSSREEAYFDEPACQVVGRGTTFRNLEEKAA